MSPLPAPADWVMDTLSSTSWWEVGEGLVAGRRSCCWWGKKDTTDLGWARLPGRKGAGRRRFLGGGGAAAAVALPGLGGRARSTTIRGEGQVGTSSLSGPRGKEEAEEAGSRGDRRVTAPTSFRALSCRAYSDAGSAAVVRGGDALGVGAVALLWVQPMVGSCGGGGGGRRRVRDGARQSNRDRGKEGGRDWHDHHPRVAACGVCVGVGRRGCG